MALRAGGSVDMIQQLKANYRRAPVSEQEMAMLEFAELLTVAPANVVEEDVQRLRDAGWRDEDIVDIVHQTALFAYMTRVADGLGIDIEPYMLEAEERDREAADTSTWGRWGGEARVEGAGR